MTTYRQFHQRSIEDPENFWAREAMRIHWQTPFECVLDNSRPPFARWFVGGKTNLCHNAVDRHLTTRGDQLALVWISTETDQRRTFTYRQLHDEVNAFAAVLASLGVGQGDRVLIYMPMTPEAVFAMLAVVRLGAIHSVVFGASGRSSLAARIDDAKPKVMITGDAGSGMGKVIPLKPLTDESIRLASHKPERVIVVNRGLATSVEMTTG